MFHLRKILPLLLLLLAVCRLVAQSTDNCLHRTMTVNVRDSNGNLVPDLPTTAFHGKLRGKPVTVRSEQVEIGPRRLVMLLDASGSITGSEYTWKIAQLVAGDIISSASRPNQVALVVFAAQVLDVTNFTSARMQVLEKLRQLEDGSKAAPKGKRRTALFDTLTYAADLFGSPMPGDVIYAITDGGDNISHKTEEDVQTRLLSKGVRFFAFYMTENNFPTEEERLGPRVLHSLAALTGGAVLDIPNSSLSPLYDLSPKGRERMAAQLRYLYDLMVSFYQLEIELPAPVDKQRHWDLEVVDKHGKTRKGVSLFYPQELMPCRIEAAKQ